MLPEDEKVPKRFLIPHLDKLIHMGIFVVFAFLWMRVGDSPRRGRWVLVAGLALAVLSELGQEVPIVNRDASLADCLADGAGVIVGLVAYEVVRRVFSKRPVLSKAL
jgi:VanZ family protein